MTSYKEMVAHVGEYLRRLHTDGYDVLQTLSQKSIAPQQNAYVAVRLPDVLRNISVLTAAEVDSTTPVGAQAGSSTTPSSSDSLASVSRELQDIARAMSYPVTPQVAMMLRERRDRALQRFDTLVIQKGEETWGRDDIDDAMALINASEVIVS
jgi:hypothetical protein